MAITARLQIGSSADQRGAPRRKLSLESNLQSTGEEVTILDLSSTGMLIETAAELAPFDDLQIELPQIGTTQALVIWSSGRYYGCEFASRLSQAAVSAAQLRSSPLQTPDPAPPQFSDPARIPAAQERIDEKPDPSTATDEKASLKVRLRVIFGSAILLWAIVIWTAVYVARFVMNRIP